MRRLTRRQRIAAVALTVVSLLFISLDFAGGALSSARGGATGGLGALYRGTDTVIGPVRRFVQGIPDVADNRAELARLRRENADLRRAVAANAVDAASSRRLDALQLQAASRSWRVMAARVIATGPGAGFEWTVTVDVGAREQVAPGQTVTDGSGLVGRVIAVYPTTSVVLLTADPTAGVGVRDTRSGQLLLASGSGSSGMTARPLDDGVDVKVGDQLVTGPAGRTTFVDGVSVGRIASVRGAADGTVRVAVRLTAPQSGLDLVGIIVGQPLRTVRAPIGSQARQ